MKTKNENLLLAFEDPEGCLLFERKLTSVSLREDSILKLSIEFFNDPEPCMIHRSAVMSRMYMELLEYFLHGMERGCSTFCFAELPDRLSSFFDIRNCQNIKAKKVE